METNDNAIEIHDFPMKNIRLSGISNCHVRLPEGTLIIKLVYHHFYKGNEWTGLNPWIFGKFRRNLGHVQAVKNRMC